ncbi:ABC transporter permease [Dechloromonas denitrificans]|uniref:ABC transporter permease n=1 Tax=Dechloromonas denitrificans TaxID=281362 RepID=UPI001CF925D2|nr:ABC transporter permease [Dechloromonas denitrificans]UCV02390.1 ABC transporter permease [Dechloromonas denitrificans]
MPLTSSPAATSPSILNGGNGEWDVVIRPRGKVVAIDLRSVWNYRDLVWMFFKRDFITFYKQTILGPLWYLIQPTLTSLTYFVVFGKIANISTNGLPPFLFYMSGIVMWTYFSACLTNNSEVFSKNASLFGKVYFPRLVVPISVAMSSFVTFGIQFALLVVTTLGFSFAGSGVTLHLPVFALLPLLICYVAALGMGVGLIVSALTVRFRDLAYATGFVTQLWMYATPVVYPYSQIPVKYQWFFNLNPMTAPVETLRSIMFGVEGVGGTVWISNLVVTVCLLFAGLVLFSRAESNAMDTV